MTIDSEGQILLIDSRNFIIFFILRVCAFSSFREYEQVSVSSGLGRTEGPKFEMPLKW